MHYRLADLIDPLLLQRLQEKLNLIYSFPSAIIDNEGKIITAVAWQDICTKFHRTNPECEKECIKSDRYILEHLHEARPAISYQCPHGLIDNATPIVIDGNHLGNFFTGQFFLEKPDLEFFKTQAKKYGFDEKAYLEAVGKVPVWTKEKLVLYLDFIKGFIEVIAGLGLDNLKLNEAKRDLEVSEEKYHQLFKNLFTGFALHEIILDEEGRPFDYRFLEVNPAFEKLTGLKAIELIGRTIREVMPDSEAYWIETYGNVALSGKSIQFENFSKPLNRFYDVTAYSPEPNRFVTIFNDITDRKQKELALKASEDKFRTLFEKASDGIFLMNPNKDLKYINESFARMHGYSVQEMSDMNLQTIDTPETFKFASERTNRILNGETLKFEVDHYDKQGNIVTQEVNTTLIDIVGEKYILAFHRDITKRKQSEVELKKKMDELRTLNKELRLFSNANKELEQFAYVASHNLQEPLRTVSNYIKLFEEDYSEQIDAKALKYLHVINDATKRMTTLLHSLLEFSRLGRNMKLSAVDCKQLINDVVSDLDTMIATSNARIIVGEMPTLNLNEPGIRQLFQNLITNAVKFRKKDAMPIIQISSERLTDKWKFSVSDNGIGIAPEYFQRIFEIFQRLHNNTEYEGNGIGLANCQRIVQLHGGEIWVESAIGEGTTFHFTIPNLVA